MKIQERMSGYKKGNDSIVNSYFIIRLSFYERIRVLFGKRIEFTSSKVLRNSHVDLGEDVVNGV